MAYTLLLVLLIIDGLVLASCVLLQAGQGGGLASMGGGTTDLVLGGRQAVTILHKATWFTGGAFMFLALLLSIVASNGAVAQSDVQKQLRQQPGAQQPVAPLPPAPLQTAPGGPPGQTAPKAVPPAPPPAPIKP